MQITEEIKRECCKRKDLIPLRAPFLTKGIHQSYAKDAMFCVHCGQIWVEDSYVDQAGGISHALTRLQISKCKLEKIR